MTDNSYCMRCCCCCCCCLTQLPLLSEVCNGTSDCTGASAYKAVVITNPHWLFVHRAEDTDVFRLQPILLVKQTSGNSVSSDLSFGGSVSCPPFCAGVHLGDGAVGGLFLHHYPCTNFASGSGYGNSGDDCSACVGWCDFRRATCLGIW